MNTKEKVLAVLIKLSGVMNINESDFLSETLGLDSLSRTLLILELEDALDVRFKEVDMNPFDLVTVADIITLAKRYAGGSNE